MNGRMIHAFRAELEALTKAGSVADSLKTYGHKALEGLHAAENPIEVGGLGLLAMPNVDNMIAKHRAAKAGLDPHDEHAVEKYRMIKEKYHDPIEAGGLGILAAPILAGRLAHGNWGH